AIDSLTVTGDGAYNGVYDVAGSVNGTGESGVGSMSFNTTTNTVTIAGSIVCSSVFGPACTSVGLVIVPSTTLVTGTGTFSNLTVSADSNGFHVTFNDTDTKAGTLLSA